MKTGLDAIRVDTALSLLFGQPVDGPVFGHTQDMRERMGRIIVVARGDGAREAVGDIRRLQGLYDLVAKERDQALAELDQTRTENLILRRELSVTDVLQKRLGWSLAGLTLLLGILAGLGIAGQM